MRGLGNLGQRTIAQVIVWAGAILSVSTVTPSFSEQTPQEQETLHLQDPVEIQSQRLEIRRPENMALYLGEVIASQKEYQLQCERLEVHWNPETKKISQLVASGDVVLETGEGKATSGKGVLNLTSKVIVMTESPRLIRGRESVEGERIIYSIAEKKSTIIGGEGRRVRSRLIPGGKR